MIRIRIRIAAAPNDTWPLGAWCAGCGRRPQAKGRPTPKEFSRGAKAACAVLCSAYQERSTLGTYHCCLSARLSNKSWAVADMFFIEDGSSSELRLFSLRKKHSTMCSEFEAPESSPTKENLSALVQVMCPLTLCGEKMSSSFPWFEYCLPTAHLKLLPEGMLGTVMLLSLQEAMIGRTKK